MKAAITQLDVYDLPGLTGGCISLLKCNVDLTKQLKHTHWIQQLALPLFYPPPSLLNVALRTIFRSNCSYSSAFSPHHFSSHS